MTGLVQSFGLSRLRRALRRLTAPGGQTYRGHVDRATETELFGWVARRSDSGGGIGVGLFVPGGLLATTIAAQHRADVQAAGIGDGNVGFVFRLTEPLKAAIARNGGEVTVRVMDDTRFEVGRYRFADVGSGALDPGAVRAAGSLGQAADSDAIPHAAACQIALFGDLTTLATTLEALSETGAAEREALEKAPPLRRHKGLFSPTSPAERPQPDLPRDTGLPAYLDYTRYRTRNDRTFDTDGTPEDADHFLDWYLSVYGPVRNGRRIPLTRDQIAYLNAPLTMGGHRNSLTRVMWWRLLRNPAMLAQMRLADPGWYAAFVYWWAMHDVRAIHAEDCLVSRPHQDLLRSVHLSRKDDAFAFSTFMDQFHAQNPAFHFLDPRKAEDRKTLFLCLLVIAIRRPDILRYLPTRSVGALLAPQAEGPSDLVQFFTALMPGSTAPAPDLDRYVAALRLQGYDYHSHSFVSVTAEGDRFEAAALPRPITEAKVDVQMIGPFKKASGLGQATRLSAAALARTRFTVNHVDFGLDNPAPEGFSKVGALQTHQRARVNLIHLNAESVPLVFAYEPDVFSDAYNIGYFFWELDTPAACHFLGMSLLDEIWVSGQYGVEIYQPQTEKPVINVGMCFEEIDAIDRPAARAALDRRFRFKGDEFVCLVAFDSYSFVQRKNPVGVLEAFGRAFKDVPNARLILKTQNRDNVTDPVQDRIWKRVQAIMDRDPRILLLNETLSYDDLLQLKAASDCYISLHRSEGWGFGMIEAMNLRVPVVCTGYSGNLEFCTEDTAWLVGYSETELEQNDYIFVRKGQKWAEPDIDHAARQLRAVFDDPEARRRKVEAAHAFVQARFSAEAIARRYEARLDEILKTL